MLGKLDSHLQQKKKEARLLSHTIHKTSSKWIKDLTIRPETIKLLEENVGSTLFNTDLSNIFMGMFFQEKEEKIKTNKCDYTNLRSSAQQKKPLKN